MAVPDNASFPHRALSSLLRGPAVGVLSTMGRYWIVDDEFTDAWQAGVLSAVMWMVLRFGFFTLRGRGGARA